MPPQMLQQLAFEDAASLDEQRAIYGFVRHLHVRIARKGGAKPAPQSARATIGAPVSPPQFVVTAPGSRGDRPSDVAPAPGDRRIARESSAMAPDLPANRGGGTPEPTCQASHRLPPGERAGNLLTLGAAQRAWGTPPRSGRHAA